MTEVEAKQQALMLTCKFLGELTGMTPPPYDQVPPEYWVPFIRFADSIFDLAQKYVDGRGRDGCSDA